MQKKDKIHSLRAIRTDSRDKHINIIPIVKSTDGTYTIQYTDGKYTIFFLSMINSSTHKTLL